MKDYLSGLRTDAWRTAGARYNASRRLKRRETFSVISLAFFSALSVGVAFVQRVYAQPGSPQDNYLSSMSAFVGIFLLAISLTEWGASNGAKADALHRNAEELNSFQRSLALAIAQLNAGGSLTWDWINEQRREYESVKSRCQYNHSPVDDRLFVAAHAHSAEFAKANAGGPAALPHIAISAYSYLSSVWYFVGCWIALALGFAPLVTCIHPSLSMLACRPT